MIKRFLVFVLVAALVFPYSAFSGVIGEFALVNGDVTVTREGQAIKPKVKDTVQTNDVISTGKNSSARVVLTDDTAMALGSGTKLEMKQFAVQGGRTTGLFSLPVGLVQTNIVKALSPGSKFEIHTPNAIVSAKGTAWLSLVELAAQGVSQSSFYGLQQSISVANAALSSQTVTVVAGNFSVVAGATLPSAAAPFSTAVVAGLTSQLGASAIPGIAGVGSAPFAGGTAGAAATGAGTASAAGAAGTAAGGLSVAGIGVGTVATVGAVAAAAIGVAVATTGKTDPTPTHTTPTHH